MALELNSSNSSQFSSQTPQLQNSMELPTPWSCSANRGGVSEHLFSYSRTGQNRCRRGVGVKLPAIATDYTTRTVFLSIRSASHTRVRPTPPPSLSLSTNPHDRATRAGRLRPPPATAPRRHRRPAPLPSPPPPLFPLYSIPHLFPSGEEKKVSSIPNPNPRGEGEEGRLHLYRRRRRRGRREAPRRPQQAYARLPRD